MTNVTPSIAINTPAIIAGNGSSAVSILAANTARIGFSVQNVGTTPAWVRIGGDASSTVYHYAIKGGTADNDGLGGSLTFTGPTVPAGAVTMYGASTAKVVALEVAP